MDQNWEKVYSSNQLQKIEIVKAVLIDHDIQSVVMDKRDSSYIFLGDIEIFVPNEDAILAKIIIEENNL